MSVVKGFQIIASLAEFGTWEAVTQPELEIQQDDWYPPGSRFPVKLFSTGKFSDITLTRAYDPGRDAKVEDWFFRYVNGLEGPRNLMVAVLNDQNVVQSTKSYVVKPLSVKSPDGKSGDGGLSEFTIKLSCEAKI
jgi:hypothetical protein